MPRPDGRTNEQLRPLVLERSANPYAEGSCLIRMGGTLVHCTASRRGRRARLQEGQRRRLGHRGVRHAPAGHASSARRASATAPAAGPRRSSASSAARSAPPCATMAFGEYTIRIDCDVLQADGGTRTASITGGCVALADACAWLAERTGMPSPFGQLVAAVSVGVVEGEERLDLAYLEDRDAHVDANVVMLEPAAVRGSAGHRRARHLHPRPARHPARSGRAEASPSCSRAQRQVLGW